MVGVGVGSACVGDDPTPAERPVGERGGSCFPNMTCNGGGLTCIDGFCLLPGDPTADGGAGDAASDGAAPGDGAMPADGGGGDAGGDAAEAGCGLPSPKGNQLQCNTADMTSCLVPQVCCTQTGQCGPTTTCPAQMHPHGCESHAECMQISPNKPDCCLLSAQVNSAAGACPTVQGFSETTCVAAGGCAGLGTVVCGAASDCTDPTKTCKSVTTVLAEGTTLARPIKLGICVPP